MCIRDSSYAESRKAGSVTKARITERIDARIQKKADQLHRKYNIKSTRRFDPSKGRNRSNDNHAAIVIVENSTKIGSRRASHEVPLSHPGSATIKSSQPVTPEPNYGMLVQPRFGQIVGQQSAIIRPAEDSPFQIHEQS